MKTEIFETFWKFHYEIFAILNFFKFLKIFEIFLTIEIFWKFWTLNFIFFNWF